MLVNNFDGRPVRDEGEQQQSQHALYRRMRTTRFCKGSLVHFLERLPTVG